MDPSDKNNQQTLPSAPLGCDLQQQQHLDSPAPDPLCRPDFETDMAKAIDLSLAEEQGAHRLDSPLSPVSPPERQCPVCDDYLVLSEVEFKQHIDRCLDEDYDTPVLPTTTDSTTVPAWRQLIQSIPTAIQDTLIGKVTASSVTNDHDNAMTISSYKESKPVPDYKWLKDTKFVVDAFSYGKIIDCEGYFLTHFHSDHYHGLTHAWNHGPIYCSRITANLVSNRFNVNDRLIHVLPMDQPTFITPTIKVTLIDANHCPGSALFIFDIQLDGGTWIRHLHTGDFRATPSMCLHPHLRQPENPTIDHLYLDTTYLDAKYGFPAQEESIQAACRLVEEHIPPHTMSQKNNSQDILVVVGSYTIGKEKVFLAIAKLLKSKIFVTSVKRSILDCQDNEDLGTMLTDNQKEAQVHVLPLNDIKPENMHAYLKSLAPRFTSLIAFKPTGWTYQTTTMTTDNDNDGDDRSAINSLSQVIRPPTDRHLTLTPQHDSPTLKIYGVPYSEHSSFRELASFIASLDINHVVPTVNNESHKSQQWKYLDRWKQDKQQIPSQIVPFTVETHW